MYSERLRAFAIDEAHAVKKWLIFYGEVNRQIDHSVLVVSFRGESFLCCHEDIRRSKELDTTCEWP